MSQFTLPPPTPSRNQDPVRQRPQHGHLKQVPNKSNRRHHQSVRQRRTTHGVLDGSSPGQRAEVIQSQTILQVFSTVQRTKPQDRRKSSKFLCGPKKSKDSVHNKVPAQLNAKTTRATGLVQDQRRVHYRRGGQELGTLHPRAGVLHPKVHRRTPRRLHNLQDNLTSRS